MASSVNGISRSVGSAGGGTSSSAGGVVTSSSAGVVASGTTVSFSIASLSDAGLEHPAKESARPSAAIKTDILKSFFISFSPEDFLFCSHELIFESILFCA